MTELRSKTDDDLERLQAAWDAASPEARRVFAEVNFALDGWPAAPGRREAVLGQAQRSCRSMMLSTIFKCSPMRVPLRRCNSSATRARHSAWHA